MLLLVFQRYTERKWHLLFTLLFSICFPVFAQDMNTLIREGNRLEAIPDENAAFHKFREVIKVNPVNIYALNKCSELCSRIGQRQKDQKARDDYYRAAKTYASIALKVNPNDGEANCVMAMALGRSSMSKTGKEKIENAREVRKYVDISLRNDPRNFKAWHILGRWHYEITNLNFLERAAVKVIYGGLPHASIKESITAFENARVFAPGLLLNYLEMAKAYKQDGQKTKAIAYLRLMLTLPNQTEDDPAIKEYGRKLLKDWD